MWTSVLPRTARRAGLLAVAALAVSACGTTSPTLTRATSTTSPADTSTGAVGSSAPGTSPAPPTTTPSTSSTPASTSVDSRGLLAGLTVDDQPRTGTDYRRDAWPHWDDTDGDGCDARQQALKNASLSPPQVDYPCAVVAGDWISPYDGFASDDPAEFDIDHLVPLEDAHISGGWAWTTEQRRQFANDQNELRVVSASANRSKGARSPDQWRPANHAYWCDYATGWVAIKTTYGLSATTAERDALGQMLDTCSPGAATTTGGLHQP